MKVQSKAESDAPAVARRQSGRPWLGLLMPTVVAFVVLIGLGVWQLERKAWKEGLIAALTARLAAGPEALPPASDWPSLNQNKDEYRRVSFTAQFENDKEALVFATGTAFRPDLANAGPGYWVFTPARLIDGSTVLVNRGFVPDGKRDPKSRVQGEIVGPVAIVGVMRWPDRRHWFTPGDEPERNLWFVRNPQAIAAAKELGPVAPFYVEQESPFPPGDLPQPGKLAVSLPDNHLQYALTWFGLAAVLGGVFLSWAYTSSGSNADQTDRQGGS
jgi:surfeit locus 1 family protein